MLEQSEFEDNLEKWKTFILDFLKESMKQGEMSLTPMLQLTFPVSLMMNELNEEVKEVDPVNELMRSKEKEPNELKLNSNKVNL
jgi:hypothetical protein